MLIAYVCVCTYGSSPINNLLIKHLFSKVFKLDLLTLISVYLSHTNKSVITKIPSISICSFIIVITYIRAALPIVLTLVVYIITETTEFTLYAWTIIIIVGDIISLYYYSIGSLPPGSSWRPLVWSSFPTYRNGSAVYKTRSNRGRYRWCKRSPDRTNIRTSTADRRKIRWNRCGFSCNRLGTRLRCLRAKLKKKHVNIIILIIKPWTLY